MPRPCAVVRYACSYEGSFVVEYLTPRPWAVVRYTRCLSTTSLTRGVATNVNTTAQGPGTGRTATRQHQRADDGSRKSPTSAMAGQAAALIIRRRTFVVVIGRSEEHTSELQSLRHLVCRLLLEKKK